MFAGRIGAIVMSRRKGIKRKRRSEEELDKLRFSEQEAIEDRDIRENTQSRLLFRKLPYPFWIMGAAFWLGGFFIIYVLHEEFFNIFTWKNFFIQLSILLFLFIMGFCFLKHGFVKTTTFDLRKDKLTLNKWNCCCKKKIRSYRISDIIQVRAVERGYKRGSVDTRHYKIELKFASNPPVSILETHNTFRVKKELLLLQKFLGFEDEEIKIHIENTKFSSDEDSAPEKESEAKVGEAEKGSDEEQGEEEMEETVDETRETSTNLRKRSDKED